jgi:uracil phosphoribosyltransferase
MSASRMKDRLSAADYSKLPPAPPIDLCFLLDPLVATGGTACAALTMILDWGVPSKTIALRSGEETYFLTVSKIKLLVVLGSKEGLEHVQNEHPNLEVLILSVLTS